MFRRLWQWLKRFFQRLFGSKQSPQSGKQRKVEPRRQPTDAEYEALFLELLAGVNEGWSRGRVKGFLDVNKITQAGLVEWLRRFGKRLLVSSAENTELASRMVQLGELGNAVSDQPNGVGEVGEVAGEIGRWLLGRGGETNRRGAEGAEEEEEGEGDADAWFDTGNEQFEAGDFEGAIASFDKAVEFKPDYHQAWYSRGNALSDLGRIEEAIASYDKAIEIKPDYHQAWYIRGLALSELGRIEEAIPFYDKAIEFKPDLHDAWYIRGLTLSELGRIEEAIASYDKAIEIKPDEDEAWYSRGNALSNLGRIEEAIASFDKAIEIKSDKDEAWNNRGNALSNLERIEEAIASFDKAIEIKPDKDEAWNNRGVALGKLGRFEEAIASCDKAVEFKPDKDEAWNNRGVALGKLGRFEEAIASYDKALEIKPDYHQAWLNRGSAAGSSVSCDPLLAFMSAIARNNPHLNQRGYEGKLASYQEGLKYCHQHTHPKGWGMLHRAIGNAYYLRGQVDSDPHSYWHKAVNSYNEALKTLTEADFPQLHLKVVRDLIRVLLALGETTAAKEWRRHGLEVFTNLFNRKKTSFQKRQLIVEFTGFSQMRVDVLVEDGEIVLALEAAERNKNLCLTWILDAQKQEILSPSYADMQRLTNPTTAVVYWHLSPFALSTFIIKHNAAQPSVISTPFFLREFEIWVKQWNQQYEDERKSEDKQVAQQNSWRDNLPQMLKQFGDILNVSAIVSEINNEIHNESIQNLILVPHRDLHRFPLHALFPEDFTTTYLPSAQVGISLQQISSTSNEESHQLLSVEHPDSAGFDILPHAEIESAAINQLFNHPDNKRLSGEQATKIAVQEALADKYNIFHFTGHGSYDFEHPKQSALVLSGEDKLTVEEVCKIDFTGYQLVTLAACETALTGNQTIENEYVGLVSAFVYQGVSNVLSTLWTVNDDESSLLVMYFYWQLKKGKPPAIALAKAKKWFRNLTDYKLERLCKVIFDKLPRDEELLRPHVRNKLWQFRQMEVADKKQKHFDDPYYWAAFTITGCFPPSLVPSLRLGGSDLASAAEYAQNSSSGLINQVR
ncbi:MAG: tetratricopeptide repeat protein [Brasilonema angustatum HA4187-MV1]|jgi:tetratricopeptide (TPR) repeat protein|nr:tetratricopeptide repeat protein [Brasilonema angustatum HA4187-MV1]